MYLKLEKEKEIHAKIHYNRDRYLKSICFSQGTVRKTEMTLGISEEQFNWENWLQADLVLLHFADATFFTSWRFRAALCWASLCYFSNSICSVCLSVSYFGNSRNIQTFSLLFVLMICNQWPLMLLLPLAEGSDDG